MNYARAQHPPGRAFDGQGAVYRACLGLYSVQSKLTSWFFQLRRRHLDGRCALPQYDKNVIQRQGGHRTVNAVGRVLHVLIWKRSTRIVIKSSGLTV